MNNNSSLELKFFFENSQSATPLLSKSKTEAHLVNVILAPAFEKCVLLFSFFMIFFAAYAHSSFILQNTSVTETVSLPDNIDPLAENVLSLPALPAAPYTQDCDPYFLEKYSKKLGFNLSCEVSKSLIEAASKWLGMQHKAKVGESGIDCSQFVRSVYLEAYGTKLNVTSKEMYNKFSRPVPKKKLKHGDLVFFNIASDDITHVGIYLQDNKFIHTSYSKGVRVSSLDDSYYANTFYAAGRVDKKKAALN